MAQNAGRPRRRLLVIGGDAAGMSAASQARRLDPDLDIVALEKGRWTSYSACGIPYLVGGDVGGIDDLIARDPQTFRTAHNIDARTRHEAMSIDLGNQKVEVRDHEHDRTYSIGYDVLHIATGALPVRPPLPGIENHHIHGVQTMEHAADLLHHAERIRPDCKVVVVGGGYIGLEMAEAFVKRGARTTVITRTPQPLGFFDPDMGELIADAIRGEGVDLQCNTSATAFEPNETKGNKGGMVVHTDKGTLDADIVVLGLGVQPNSRLAKDAGIATGTMDAITVDRRQRTNYESVYAAGDCCESFERVTGNRVYVALGTVANKQGRTAGTNIGGGYASFPGVIGTAVTKICKLECARTGLNEREATQAGFEYTTATIDSTTRAGYYPGAAPIKVKFLAERRSGRLIGAQILGEEGAAKRIDVVATAITAGMTVEEFTALDLSYAPPFSPVWDPLLIAARKIAETL